MGFKLSNIEFNDIIKELSKNHKVYAPKRVESRGRFSDTDLILYKEIEAVEEIVYDKKSTYSPKEIITPITQTMFYFNEDGYKEANIDDKKIVIFIRPCDINALRRLDTIFLKNGDTEDYYYKRLREKVTIIMIECKESFENCFCVSMKSNKTEKYDLAVRISDEGVLCTSNTKEFTELLSKYKEVDFKPKFVKKNINVVNVPNITDINKEIFNHEMWDEFNARCIACGRCTTTCSTCTCFNTTDLHYDDNPNSGERRRTWASCHIDGFTTMAGGHNFRKDNASRMRFKAMHKIYDYQKRFGENMCVGCSRCDDICPQYIKFSSTINKISNVLKEGGKDGK